MFRQFTAKEKEKIAEARRLYREFIGQDAETQKMIDSTYGEGKARALNSPQTRALWRVGVVTKWGGAISETRDSNNMWNFTAFEGRGATEMDAYFMCLGSLARVP